MRRIPGVPEPVARFGASADKPKHQRSAHEGANSVPVSGRPFTHSLFPGASSMKARGQWTEAGSCGGTE